MIVCARDIRLVMEGKPRNLIETVASDIATNILQDYREVKGLKISVQKPHVALDGVVKSMGEASLGYWKDFQRKGHQAGITSQMPSCSVVAHQAPSMQRCIQGLLHSQREGV